MVQPTNSTSGQEAAPDRAGDARCGAGQQLCQPDFTHGPGLTLPQPPYLGTQSPQHLMMLDAPGHIPPVDPSHFPGAHSVTLSLTHLMLVARVGGHPRHQMPVKIHGERIRLMDAMRLSLYMRFPKRQFGNSLVASCPARLSHPAHDLYICFCFTHHIYTTWALLYSASNKLLVGLSVLDAATAATGLRIYLCQ